MPFRVKVAGYAVWAKATVLSLRKLSMTFLKSASITLIGHLILTCAEIYLGKEYIYMHILKQKT